MDPLIVAALIGAGGSFLSGLLEDSGQERQAFSGNLSPERLLNTALGSIGGLSDYIGQTDYEFPDAYVQTPPGYIGGGLPMRIGVTGVDPRVGVGISMGDVVKRRAPYSFKGIAEAGMGTPGARRRTPGAVTTGKAVPRGQAQASDAAEALSALELLRGARRRREEVA